MSERRQWVMDALLGVVLGGVTGAIVAVNFIITIGIGYDVTFVDVFEHSTLAGIVTVAILIMGPIAGVVLLRRRRQRRPSP